jgi:hypothetical protein
MLDFVQQTISGVALGCACGLIAPGFVLIDTIAGVGLVLLPGSCRLAR